MGHGNRPAMAALTGAVVLGTLAVPSVAASADAEAAAVGRPAAKAATVYSIDRGKMATYAKYWGSKKRGLNPNYPDTGDNCTNFVSQALRAGGWKFHGSVDRGNSHNWFVYHVPFTDRFITSKTWSKVDWLYVFATQRTDRAAAMNRVKVTSPRATAEWVNYLRDGDFIMFDWSPNGHPRRPLDHAVIVTGKKRDANGQYEPRISARSRPHSNIPLTEELKAAKRGHKVVYMYPVVLNDVYTT